MADRKVQVFFYGSFMSLKVLQDAGLKKRAFAPACIHGYELTMQPHANLSESGDGIVFGILANMTHKELGMLYDSHASTITHATYQPEAMMVFTRGGKMVPALVYMAADEEAGAPDEAYVDDILKSCTSYGFPSWYLERIASFKP